MQSKMMSIMDYINIETWTLPPQDVWPPRDGRISMHRWREKLWGKEKNSMINKGQGM